MADDTASNTQVQRPAQGAGGQPRLKKVKRAIKKLVKKPLSPLTAHSPVPPQNRARIFEDEELPVHRPARKNEDSFQQVQNPVYPSRQTMPSGNVSMPTVPQPDDDVINLDDMDDIKSIIADMSEQKKQQEKEEENLTANLPETVSNIQNINEEPPAFISDQDLAAPKESFSFLSADGTFSKRVFQIGLLVAFVLGFGIAKLFFAEQKVVSAGLQGVVVNPEVPRGRARCGIAEGTQGCVLYLMNPQRQDLNARDFYDLASQLTGRQRFVIETGNMRYSNVKISPGEIAQFNIPPLQ